MASIPSPAGVFSPVSSSSPQTTTSSKEQSKRAARVEHRTSLASPILRRPTASQEQPPARDLRPRITPGDERATLAARINVLRCQMNYRASLIKFLKEGIPYTKQIARTHAEHGTAELLLDARNVLKEKKLVLKTNQEKQKADQEELSRCLEEIKKFDPRPSL